MQPDRNGSLAQWPNIEIFWIIHQYITCCEMAASIHMTCIEKRAKSDFRSVHGQGKIVIAILCSIYRRTLILPLYVIRMDLYVYATSSPSRKFKWDMTSWYVMYATTFLGVLHVVWHELPPGGAFWPASPLKPFPMGHLKSKSDIVAMAPSILITEKARKSGPILIAWVKQRVSQKQGRSVVW